MPPSPKSGHGAPFEMTVPLLHAALERPAAERIRALKKHLVRSLRELRTARRPEKRIQKPAPAPAGFTAAVLSAGCATCQGHCCTGGGEHAYIDERTMARVRRDNPDLDARAIIRLYVERVAHESYRGSCLFHGRDGCTLGRGLRAHLCDTYYCNGLLSFLKQHPRPERVRVTATRDGRTRAGPVVGDDAVAG